MSTRTGKIRGVLFGMALCLLGPRSYAQFPPAPGTGPAQAIEQMRAVNTEDLMDSDVYRSGDQNRRAVVDLAGARSSLMVPLLRNDQALGIINVLFAQTSQRIRLDPAAASRASWGIIAGGVTMPPLIPVNGLKAPVTCVKVERTVRSSSASTARRQRSGAGRSLTKCSRFLRDAKATELLFTRSTGATCPGHFAASALRYRRWILIDCAWSLPR